MSIHKLPWRTSDHRSLLKRIVLRPLTILMLCVMLLNCVTATAVERYIYSRVNVDEQVGMSWVDNISIIFRGYPDGVDIDALSKKPSQGLDRDIDLLNVETGILTKYASADKNSAFCFSNGTILYSQSGDVKFGRFGSERIDPQTQKRIREGVRSWIRCTTPELRLSPEFPERVIALLEEHGFLEMKFPEQSERKDWAREFEIYLWQPGSTKPVKIREYQLRHAINLANGSVYFAPFKGAYFNSGILTENERSDEVSRWIGWWLYPDGRTEAVTIPEGSWQRSSSSLSGFLLQYAIIMARCFDGHGNGLSTDRSRYGLPATALSAGVVTQVAPGALRG